MKNILVKIERKLTGNQMSKLVVRLTKVFSKTRKCLFLFLGKYRKIV